MLTRLYIYTDFSYSDAQGQITLQSLVKTVGNSNSSKLVWLSLLSARMKKIQSTMKGNRVLQYFSHYKTMGIFLDTQRKLTPQSLVESGLNSN